MYNLYTLRVPQFSIKNFHVENTSKHQCYNGLDSNLIGGSFKEPYIYNFLSICSKKRV